MNFEIQLVNLKQNSKESKMENKTTNNNQTIRLILIDDHKLFRCGIKSLFETCFLIDIIFQNYYNSSNEE